MVNPIQWTAAEAMAIRALAADETHKFAMDAILFKACGIRDLCFQSEAQGGQWETAFHLGRRAVGLAIVNTGAQEVGEKIAERNNRKEAKRREAENG